MENILFGVTNIIKATLMSIGTIAIIAMFFEVRDFKESISFKLVEIERRIENLNKIDVTVDLGDRVIKRTESDGMVTISENPRRYEHWVSPATPPQYVRCKKCDRR